LAEHLPFVVIYIAAVVAVVIGGFASYSWYQSSLSLKLHSENKGTVPIANVNSLTRTQSSNNNSSVQKLQGSSQASEKRVAFVRPTFTYAAYQLNGFYNFYKKYSATPERVNITKHLDLLTVKVPQGPFKIYNDKPSAKPSPPREKDYIGSLMQLVKNQGLGRINISDMTDEQVNDGLIFSQDGGNKYDILFLFHEEYVTQKEYNNLKQFVADGGTIVFNDANVFTTEISYNRTNDSITLIKGHTWQFDGKSAAWRTDRERWANETQQWVGSNFMQEPTEDNITFSNNPFGYHHVEEQYATNAKDKIILDFGAKDQSGPDQISQNIANSYSTNQTVAIYELSYGKGKVIMLSIFSYKLEHNKAFLDFYDKEIVPRAFS
jgi:hypothetical protein